MFLLLPKRKYIGTRRPTVINVLPNSHKLDLTLEDAVEIFVKAKEAEGMCERTLKEYKAHFRYLKRYLDKCHPEIRYLNQLDSQIIREYIVYMKNLTKYEGFAKREKEGELSVNTINMRLRTLRTMCNFWYDENYIHINPMKQIKQVRHDEGEEVRGLSDEEIELILKSLNTSQYAEWRDRTLILLLLDAGLRINEAASLTIHDIDPKSQTIHVSSDVSKNRTAREVPVSKEVIKELRKLHLESCAYFGDHDRIFMNAYGEPFTADAFRRRLNRLKRKINLDRLYPHMFRHTFIRGYILQGGDLFTLQKIVGHADIKTTRKYVQMETKHLKEQHNKFSPAKSFF